MGEPLPEKIRCRSISSLVNEMDIGKLETNSSYGKRQRDNKPTMPPLSPERKVPRGGRDQRGNGRGGRGGGRGFGVKF